MSERKMIRGYLAHLEKYLQPLSPDDRGEVIKEIESHIYDVIDNKEIAGEEADVKAILEGFGPPRELASDYVEHLTLGTPPPAGFGAIQQVKKQVATGVYWGMWAFGYGVAAALFFLGFLNLLFPHAIGIWSENDGNSVIIGWLSNPVLGQDEKIYSGFSITPIALILGYLVAWLSKRILHVLKHQPAGSQQ